mmetsp:Transcript_33905/g.76674  ORF Transcript_33905/g.76674 Transcript_33905/m.76674 type:complete len:261 (-) Transcript_33905:138-920(-)
MDGFFFESGASLKARELRESLKLPADSVLLPRWYCWYTSRSGTVGRRIGFGVSARWLLRMPMALSLRAWMGLSPLSTRSWYFTAWRSLAFVTSISVRSSRIPWKPRPALMSAVRKSGSTLLPASPRAARCSASRSAAARSLASSAMRRSSSKRWFATCLAASSRALRWISSMEGMGLGGAEGFKGSSLVSMPNSDFVSHGSDPPPSCAIRASSFAFHFAVMSSCPGSAIGAWVGAIVSVIPQNSHPIDLVGGMMRTPLNF